MKARLPNLSLLLLLALALVLAGCPKDDGAPPPPEDTSPYITSVSPSSGPMAGGLTVWLFGDRFDPAGGTTTVTFGTTDASSVTVHSAHAISCALPAGAAGGVDVTVTNPDAEAITLPNAFQYGADNVVDESAIQLQEVDAYGCCFPSDMGFAMDASMAGLLFVTVESMVDATNGASVQALDLDLSPIAPASGYTTFTLDKTDLVHSDGATAVGAADTFGSYFSEAYTDDLLVVHAHLAFLTVSASQENDAPFLANLAVYDPTAGTLLQPVVNLALSYTHPVSGQVRSDGSAIPADTWTQTNPSGLVYVPGTGTQGKLYVSMSNVYDSSSFPMASAYNPGTVMVFDVDTSAGTPLTVTPAATLPVSKWNPTHLTHHTTAAGAHYVLVTEAGATGYYGSTGYGNSNPPYIYVSHTDAAIEILDPATDTYVSWDPDGAGPDPARTTIDLGLAAPNFDDIIQTATDAGGNVVGFLASSFYGRLYTVELTGLESTPVDGTALRPLRNAYDPIFVFSNQGTTHDYGSSVAVSPNAAYAFLTDFNQNLVHVVGLPSDLEDGTFTVHPPYFETPFVLTVPDAGLAQPTKLLFRTGAYTGPEAFVLVSNVEMDFPADNENYGVVTSIHCQGRVK